MSARCPQREGTCVRVRVKVKGRSQREGTCVFDRREERSTEYRVQGWSLTGERSGAQGTGYRAGL